MTLSFSFGVKALEGWFHRQAGEDLKGSGLDSYKVCLIEELGAKTENLACYPWDIMWWFPSEKQRTETRAGSAWEFAAAEKLSPLVTKGSNQNTDKGTAVWWYLQMDEKGELMG